MFLDAKKLGLQEHVIYLVSNISIKFCGADYIITRAEIIADFVLENALPLNTVNFYIDKATQKFCHKLLNLSCDRQIRMLPTIWAIEPKLKNFILSEICTQYSQCDSQKRNAFLQETNRSSLPFIIKKYFFSNINNKSSANAFIMFKNVFHTPKHIEEASMDDNNAQLSNNLALKK
jgi:hypothetical protein